MKNKVAICIAGEMRYWEITKNIFNSFDADIFISTWDTNDRQDNYPYKFHGNKNMNNEIIDSLDNLVEAEFLPKEIENKFTFNIPKYWYLIHRCNLLKTKKYVLIRTHRLPHLDRIRHRFDIVSTNHACTLLYR